MRHVLLVLLVATACDSDATPTPKAPRPFTRAELETMMTTPLDTYTADLVPGLLENRANRRYTKTEDDGMQLSIVVSAGTCAPACLSMRPETFRDTVDPSELATEADRNDRGSTGTSIDIAARKLPDGRHGIAVFTRSLVGSRTPFARYTVYFNNGVNDLRVRVTAILAGDVAASTLAHPDSTDMLLDLLKSKLERDATDALVSFVRYY